MSWQMNLDRPRLVVVGFLLDAVRHMFVLILTGKRLSQAKQAPHHADQRDHGRQDRQMLSVRRKDGELERHYQKHYVIGPLLRPDLSSPSRPPPVRHVMQYE